MPYQESALSIMNPSGSVMQGKWEFCTLRNLGRHHLRSPFFELGESATQSSAVLGGFAQPIGG